MERARPRARRRTFLAATAIAAIAAPLAGCGSEDEETLGIGPPIPAGEIVTSTATLLPQDPFSTLAAATVRIRGEGKVLVAAVAEIGGDEGAPRLRLVADGKPVEADPRIVSEGGRTTAVLACACDVGAGDHELELQGKAGGGTASVGPRSLTVFTAPAFDADRPIVVGDAISTEETEITAEGATLAELRLEDDANPLLVITAFRVPKLTSVSAADIRLEALVGGRPAEPVATRGIPAGKLTAFLARGGADAGTEVELRGFVTAGTAPVATTTAVACPCGLSVQGP